MRSPKVIAAVAVVGLSVAACSGPNSSSGGSVSGGSTIKIGLITSLSGQSSADYAPAEAAAQARIDLQNSQGGVNGHKLELITADDQSTPAGTVTAIHQLVARDGVFGVVSTSTTLVSAASYLQKQGVPVTGDGFDGPEWGQQPNTNMFSLDPVNPSYPPTTVWGKFFKSIGVTRVAGIAYADIPSSSDSLVQTMKSATAAGLDAAYTNLSIPYGTTDFTSIVLQMKQARVNGFLCSCTAETELALATAVKQAGLNAVGVLSTGYAQSTLDSASAKAAAEGDYAFSYWVPYGLHAAGTNAMLAALAKYDPGYKTGEIPTYGMSEAYLSTDLMIEGLMHAGKDPTRSSFISGLRTVTAYDADGALTQPVTFALDQFGKTPSKPCSYFVRLTGNGFVPQPKICGTLLSG
jgi:branched-chain amino acid transport system substrate-binding protein